MSILINGNIKNILIYPVDDNETGLTYDADNGTRTEKPPLLIQRRLIYCGVSVLAVVIECNKTDCVWRFSTGHCTRKNLKIDDIGVCLGQESANRLMTQYPGSQSPKVSHGSHGYTQGHGMVIR